MTIKQKKFVENYIKGDNATQAAIKAGYKPKNARIRASENVTKSNIKSEIDKRKAEIEAKTNITVESIQKEHQYYQKLAEEKGDLSTATANLVAKGRTIAAYSDNLNTTDVIRAQELSKCSEEEAQELKRLANIRLVQMSQVKAG